MKPFFTDKSKTYSNIILNENDKALKDCKEIANKPADTDVLLENPMNELDNIHEKCLRLATNDYDSNCQKLPESANEL